MTCKCICRCKNEASGDTNRTPELCLACDLCDALGNARHGLPYTPVTIKPLDPEVAITDEQKNEAIQNFVVENGF